MRPIEASMARADISYKPSSANKCENIAFIQVATVAKYTDGVLFYAAGNPTQHAFLQNNKLYDNNGAFVDVLPGYKQIYYNAAWSKAWVSPDNDPEAKVGSGTKNKASVMWDTPGTRFVTGEPKRFAEKGFEMKFETAAVCVETNEVLGVLKWGFSVPTVNGGPLTVFPTQVALDVSNEFKAAIVRANKSGIFDEIKYGLPASFNFTIHRGSSVLPGATLPTLTGE